MKAAVSIFVLALCAVGPAGCKRSSAPAPSASNNQSPTGPMARRAPPVRPTWRADPTKGCPTMLPGVQVRINRLAKGVRVTVDGASAADAKRILSYARYLLEATLHAPAPAMVLDEKARAHCAVVVTHTKLVVKPRPLGAEILVTPKGNLKLEVLWDDTKLRYRLAFPKPEVKQWKCGAFEAKPLVGLQLDQQRAIFGSSPEEKLVPTGWDQGSTTISNEARLELFQKAVKDLGGGYIGVGSTQNFVLAAWADAQWVWLMDFTAIVVLANKAHIAFIQEAKTAQAFLALWNPANKEKALGVIRNRLSGDPERKRVEQAYLTAAKFVNKRFGQLAGWTKQYKFETWLSSPQLYQRIRRLALEGRIRALRGDLNGPRTLCGIGEAAKRLGVPIRILYPSNAEEYKVFRPYKWTFRRNVRNLPADARSLVLRTYTFSPSRLPWPKGWKGVSKVGFHYNAQPLRGFQALLKLPKLDVKQVMTKAADPDRDGFSLSKP